MYEWIGWDFSEVFCNYCCVDLLLVRRSLLLLLAFLRTAVHDCAVGCFEGCAFHAAVWFGSCCCFVLWVVRGHAALSVLGRNEFHVFVERENLRLGVEVPGVSVACVACGASERCVLTAL